MREAMAISSCTGTATGLLHRGSVVDASSLSAPALWEYDMFVVASEAIQEMNADLLSCLVELSFHRASIVFSLQNLCYRCFTGIWPLGVQDAVLVDRSLKAQPATFFYHERPQTWTILLKH